METMASSGKRYVAVAIDGPAGAGKTSLAKELSKRLGYIYVDTGAIYRAFGIQKLWLQREHGDEPVTNMTVLNTFNLEYEKVLDGEPKLMVWGRCINEYLRLPEVSMEASNVGTDEHVRAALTEFMRKQAYGYDVIMEGRDIGTVVLPDAQVKIFLTADLPVRAERRFKELQSAGKVNEFDKLLEDMRIRDEQDTNRTVSPLCPADDAVRMDNTRLTFEETVEIALGVVRSRLGS